VRPIGRDQDEHRSQPAGAHPQQEQHEERPRAAKRPAHGP
jgi:hypothetical protein